MIKEGTLPITQGISEPDTQNDTIRGVMQHIMFHRALVDEADDGRKYDRYMEMVDNLKKDAALEYTNPFERGVAEVFKLAVAGEMDPWNIDLLRFAKLYLQHLQKTEYVNLMAAGKVMAMAWQILRKQSEDALQSAELKKAEEDYPFYGWDIAPFQPAEEDVSWEPIDGINGPEPNWPEGPESDGPPLKPKIRHEERRTVSLIELAEAFGEAYREAELNTLVKKMGKKEKKVMKFRNPTHKEDQQEDIEFTWKRIEKFDVGPIALTDLYEPEGGKEELMTIFTSLLFLANAGKLHVWQKDLPYGEIYAEVRVPFEIAKIENIPAASSMQGIPIPERRA